MSNIIFQTRISSMKKVLFLASGSGSNIENIIEYFKNKSINIDSKIITNRKNAGVFERASRLQVPIYHFSKDEIQSEIFYNFVKDYQPDLIVLAGFLLIFPADVLVSMPNKVINIHPALLPNYGGKGMYGMNVHEAVFENKEQFTGITIHYVNEKYDEGEIILQQKIDISNCKNADEIAVAVHQLEYKYFPEVIENLLFK